MIKKTYINDWKKIYFLSENVKEEGENSGNKNENSEKNLLSKYNEGDHIIMRPDKFKDIALNLEITEINYSEDYIILADNTNGINETKISFMDFSKAVNKGNWAKIIHVPKNLEANNLINFIKENFPEFQEKEIKPEGVFRHNIYGAIKYSLPYEISGGVIKIAGEIVGPIEFIKRLVENDVNAVAEKNKFDTQRTITASSDKSITQQKINLFDLYQIFQETISKIGDKEKERAERRKLNVQITMGIQPMAGWAGSKLDGMMNKDRNDWKGDFDQMHPDDIVAWIDSKTDEGKRFKLPNQGFVIQRYDVEWDSDRSVEAALLSYISRKGTVTVNKPGTRKFEYWFERLGLMKEYKQLSDVDDDIQKLTRALMLYKGSRYNEVFINAVGSEASKGAKEKTQGMNDILKIGDDGIKSWKNLFWMLGLNDTPQEFLAKPDQYGKDSSGKPKKVIDEITDPLMVKNMPLHGSNGLIQRMKGRMMDLSHVDPIEFWDNLIKTPIGPGDKMIGVYLYVLGSFDENGNTIFSDAETAKMVEKTRKYAFPFLPMMHNKKRGYLKHLFTDGAEELGLNTISDMYEFFYGRDNESKIVQGLYQGKYSKKTRNAIKEYINSYKDQFTYGAKNNELKDFAMIRSYPHEMSASLTMMTEQIVDAALRGGEATATNNNSLSDTTISEFLGEGKKGAGTLTSLRRVKDLIKETSDPKEKSYYIKLRDDFGKLVESRLLEIKPSGLRNLSQKKILDVFVEYSKCGIKFNKLIKEITSDDFALSATPTGWKEVQKSMKKVAYHLEKGISPSTENLESTEIDRALQGTRNQASKVIQGETEEEQLENAT